MTYQPHQSEDLSLKAYSCAKFAAGQPKCDGPCGNCISTDDDFPLPPACPLRNEGDDICEACQ
jgi:hypothetical protein